MKRTMIVCAVLALFFTATASAASTKELKDRAHRIIAHVEKAKTTIRWFERHHHGKSIAWLQAHPKALNAVNIARQRVILGRAELARVRAILKRRERPTLPAHYREWLCIYSHENGGYGWSANTRNGYHGGLQMDREFERDYGARLLATKGDAENWTPLEQMWVAERAWRTRGFGPWPNTARMCGLLR